MMTAAAADRTAGRLPSSNVMRSARDERLRDTSESGRARYMLASFGFA